MRVKQILLACALLGAGLAIGQPLVQGAQAQAQAQTPASPEQAIAERKAGLKRMAGHMEAIKGIVDGGGDVAPVAARAEDMVSFYQTFPALFPPGSDRGETKARPEAWSDRAGFERAAANMLGATQKLQAAAASGDKGAVATAFRETGATCGACHRGYRAR